MNKDNKKRKRNDNGQKGLDTSKPSALFTPTGGRSWTVSVAIPGSFISNAKSHDRKNYLAGHIARALAVFCVDEVVVFDDGSEGAEASRPVKDKNTYTAFSHPSHFLSHILSYLETPAQLRKALFGGHPNLRTAGALPSMDMPHHLRAHEWCDYREGVVVGSDDKGTYVDVGLADHRVIEGVQIPQHTRVTLKLDTHTHKAEAVSPSEPREVAGYYWGYTLRQCGSLSAVLTESPFDGGYDLSIGTSERGQPLADMLGTEVPDFQHLLLVFGGVAGLELAAVNDPKLQDMDIGKKNIGELFDFWINVLPGQGSRTIRTEEAVWLGLMGTRKLVEHKRS